MKKRKPLPHAFKKGNKANTKGRPPASPELKAIRMLTQTDLAEVGGVLLRGTQDDLDYIINDPKSSVLQVWVAKIARRGIRWSSEGPLDALLDRFAGPVKRNFEFTGKGGGPIEVAAVPYTDEQKRKMAEEYLAASKAKMPEAK